MAGSVVAFDCSAAVEHTVSACEVVSSKGEFSHPNVPIGWNVKYGDEFFATGVDRIVGELRERYAVRMKVSKLTATWRATIANTVGRTNKEKFNEWNSGTALFLGCSYTIPSTDSKGAVDKDKEVDVYFHFLIRPDGFDHYWCTYKEGKDETTGEMTIVPDIKFTAQLYPTASFEELGI
jgi:hypothetical protein